MPTASGASLKPTPRLRRPEGASKDEVIETGSAATVSEVWQTNQGIA